MDIESFTQGFSWFWDFLFGDICKETLRIFEFIERKTQKFFSEHEIKVILEKRLGRFETKQRC
jgi:hypothetical protein